MSDLLNKERMFYGTLEFFSVGVLIGLIIRLLGDVNEHFFNGWLLWVLILGYTLIIPLFLKGQTLFMYIFNLEVLDNAGNHPTYAKIFQRWVVKYSLLLIPVGLFHIVAFKSDIPLYDKFLNLKIVKA